MLITETSTGTILIQSGDDAVELTRAEASRAAEQLAGYDTEAEWVEASSHPSYSRP